MIMKPKGQLESLVEEQLSQIGDSFDKLKYINGTQADPSLSSEQRRYLSDLSRQIIEEAQRASITDGLTKLRNRRSFDEDLIKEISQVRRNSVRYGVQENKSLSLLFLDIDHFKQYNDQYGHQKGDQILKDVAENAVRYSRGARVYRYGGEEFAILMPETRPDEAETAANRLNRFIREKTGVTVSIGVANYTAHVEDSYRIQSFANAPDIQRSFFEKNIKEVSEELVSKADKAMYYAKSMGKDRTILYSPTLSKSYAEAVQISGVKM